MAIFHFIELCIYMIVSNHIYNYIYWYMIRCDYMYNYKSLHMLSKRLQHIFNNVFTHIALYASDIKASVPKQPGISRAYVPQCSSDFHFALG